MAKYAHTGKDQRYKKLNTGLKGHEHSSNKIIIALCTSWMYKQLFCQQVCHKYLFDENEST